MVTEQEYLDAVSIVNEYFAQIDANNKALRKRAKQLRIENSRALKEVKITGSITPDSSIYDLPGHIRLVNILNILGYKDATLKDVSNMSEKWLLQQRNCGRNTVDELKGLLSLIGLELRP